MSEGELNKLKNDVFSPYKITLVNQKLQAANNFHTELTGQDAFVFT